MRDPRGGRTRAPEVPFLAVSSAARGRRGVLAGGRRSGGASVLGVILTRMTGRTLAIGDIHGCEVALAAMLELLQLQRDDVLIVLGDAIDRGPRTDRVLELLLAAGERCQLIFLMGNHEEMMIHALSGRGGMSSWLEFGGSETLSSYGGNVGDIPHSHVRLLTTAQSYWETENEIFVHANLEPGVSLADQSAEWLRWTPFSPHQSPFEAGKRVICGHTAQKNGVPLAADGWLCIDTYCWGGQYLTCIDVATDEIYQASQAGEVRRGSL